MAVQSSPFLTRQLELTSPSISRMAPLLYVYRDDPEELIASAGAQTAFPGVIHLITKYESDLKQALVENVMAGGDSAGRGLIIGMVLGAHLGMDAIPPKWLTDMKAYLQIVDMLSRIDRVRVLHG